MALNEHGEGRHDHAVSPEPSVPVQSASGAPAGREVSVEEAMQRVLGAEAEAERAVLRCRAETARILDAARARARHIDQRTDRRISALHRLCAVSTEDRIARLKREEAQRAARARDPDQERRCIEAVALEVAALLTGAEPD
jgi:hypothetical protein